MESKYENLEKLNDLFKKGVVNETEYNTEKAKILNKGGIIASTDNDNQYSMWMHLSQFSDVILPSGGLIIPIVMWLTRKEKDFVDINGKIILNWKISLFIYYILWIIAAVVGGLISVPITDQTDNPIPVIGWAFGGIILPAIFLGSISLLFTIIGAIKASKGEVWNYPLSIKFFKTQPPTPKGEF